MTPTGLKELVVLRRPLPAGVPAAFRFPLHLQGLDARQEPDGGIGLYDAAGARALVIPPGTASDAEGASAPVRLSLVHQAGATFVDVEAEAGWISDPARTYPLAIDPTFRAGSESPRADTYVAEDLPDTNFNGTDQFNPNLGRFIDKVGREMTPPFGNSSGEHESFLFYDLLPLRGQQIVSATWNGFFPVSTYETVFGVPSSYAIHPVDGRWNAEALTWNSRPNRRGDTALGIARNNQWSAVDLTAFVAGWASGAWANDGIVVENRGQDALHAKYLAAAENTDGTASYIDVTFNGQRQPVRRGQSRGTGSPRHAKPTSPHRSDPVSTAIGNFVTTATDAVLDGGTLPFAFTRTYNSDDPASGPMGVGWTHDYAVRLLGQANGDMVVRAEDGQQLYYTRRIDGTYFPDPGVLSNLLARPGGFELIGHDQIRYNFDPAGRLTSVASPDGHTTTLAYDGAGRLASVTDSAGRTVAFTHDGAGLLTEVALPDGRRARFSYLGGRLATSTDLAGGATAYSYDGAGRLATIVDPEGHTVVTNTYGADGRVVSQSDALGNTTSFSWDPATQTSRVTGPRGGTITDVFSGDALEQSIDPVGNVTSLVIDADLNVAKVTDAKGHTTEMAYDERGNVVAVTDPAPLSYVRRFSYDAANRLTAATDAKGNSTALAYDAAGHLAALTGPDGARTTFAYDASGDLVAETDPLGRTTRFGYDTVGNPVQVTSPAGSVTTLAYDTSGRLTSVVDPRGNVAGADPDQFRTRFSYDANDNLVSETDPLGNATSYAYDAADKLRSGTDANGRATRYLYNAAGLLSSVVAPDATTTSYSYDAARNLVARTDAKGRVSTYEYDLADRLAATASPTNQRLSYSYDANSNLAKVIDASGHATADPTDGTTTYRYDEVDRLVRIDYSDEATTSFKALKAVADVKFSEETPDVTFGYDANDNRTTMADGTGVENATYDALDRLVSVKRGTISARGLSYAYDSAGQLSSMTYPDATVVSYAYDADGRLVGVTEPAGTTTYAYDPADNPVRTALPNGQVETTGYDRAGRLVSMATAKGAAALSSFSYAYDAVGNPTKATGPAGTEVFSYDAMGRLTQVCYDASCPNPLADSIAWAYDSVGNRVSEKRRTGTTTYAYNDADQLTKSTTAGGELNYSYDPDGNMVSRADEAYAYDADDRLVAEVRGGMAFHYAYDGDGKRATATTRPLGLDAIATTRYTWDPNSEVPELLAEADADYKTTRRYTYGLDSLSLTDANGAHFLHHDAIGSVTAVTATDGRPQWSYAYEPFGAERSATRLDAFAPTNPARFAGEYLDVDTGYYHLRARQYDPGVGRFTSTDPVSPEVEDPYVSSYVYANNAPTMFIDPTGLFCIGGKNPNGSCRGSGAAKKVVKTVKRVARSRPARIVKKVTGVVSVVTGAGAGFAGAVTLACPFCAPVSGPIAGGLATTSTLTGTVSAAIDCADGGRRRSCPVGFALSALGFAGGGAIKAATALGRRARAGLQGTLSQFTSAVSTGEDIKARRGGQQRPSPNRRTPRRPGK